MANVLELSKIRKSFGAELVLNDLSLSVPEHTATVLIGASGSGKSTFILGFLLGCWHNPRRNPRMPTVD